LDALNRKDEAAAVRNRALPLGTVVQLHTYGRQLQQQGNQEQAFELFRVNIKKNPDHWVAHNEAARLACAEGKFDDAAKQMRLAVAAAPDQFKPALESLAKRLDAKEDINK
jgi:tetratricopeptide (TPR) repeat protein